MMRDMKKWLAILLLAAMTPGCAKGPQEKGPIRLGINVWPGYAHAFIAQEKGFFRRNGVEVELVFKKETAESKELYRDGEVAGFFGVFADAIMLNEQGFPTKVVYIIDYSVSGDVIIGKPELNSLADLKDKKVSFEGVNTFSHIFVLKALEKAAINESEVRFEDIPAHDVLGALESGRIEAGHTWEPTKSKALRKGYKILAKAGDFPGIITDVLVFNARVVRNRPDAIRSIIKSLAYARDFVQTNREEALTIMAKAEGMSKEEMNDGIRGIFQPDLKENVEAMEKAGKDGALSLYECGRQITGFYIDRGQMTKMPDFDDIIDSRFVNDLAREAQI